MSKSRWTFDQIIYSIVALPTLFFASYIVSGVIGFFIFGYFARRFRLEELDRKLGISSFLGDGTAAMLLTALIMLIPASIMTKRFFIAGWPKSKGDKDQIEHKGTGDG